MCSIFKSSKTKTTEGCYNYNYSHLPSIKADPLLPSAEAISVMTELIIERLSARRGRDLFSEELVNLGVEDVVTDVVKSRYREKIQRM